MAETVIIENQINVKLNKNEYENEFFHHLIVVLCIVIIIVNFFVVLSSGFLLQKGQEPRATYVYLGNVSLADMIIGISTSFIRFYPHQFHNEIVCSISISLTTASSMASVFTIGLIAIDRYLYILYGLHYHRYITSQHPPWVVSLIWFASTMFAFVSVFVLRNPMEEHICCIVDLLPAKLSLVLVFMGAFQMTLIIVLYGIILKNALNSMSRMHCASVSSNLEDQAKDLRISCSRTQITSNSENEDLPSSSSGARSFGLPCCRTYKITFAMRPPTFCKNKWKAVKIVFFTAGAFFVTWFPNYVASILYAFCDPQTDIQFCENVAYALSNPLALVSLSNSLLNPIIYAWWHQGFRESVKKMYSKLLGKKAPMTKRSCSEPKTDQTFSSKQM